MKCFKRFFCLLLTLLTVFSTAALAEQEDTLPRMAELNALLDACADVCDALQQPALSAENADMPAAACLILSRLLARGQLPGYAAENGQITLSQAEVEALYGQLFAGSIALPTPNYAGLLALTESGYTFDCSLETTSTAGMQIMLASGEEGADVQSLLLELYRVPGPWAADAQATLLGADWFGSALAQVRPSEVSPLGWQLVSWGPADDLEQSGMRTDDTEEALCWYQDAAGLLTVQYPALLAQGTIDSQAESFHAELPGEGVSFDVTVSDEAATLAQAAQASEEAHPGALVTVYEERQFFTAAWDENGLSHYEAAYVTGGRRYTAAFTYPTDQMERYAVYAAYMENSFTLLTLSVG